MTKRVNKPYIIFFKITDEALRYLSVIPNVTRNVSRKYHRLIRIRKNFLREMEAFNKELNRHDLTKWPKI